MTMPADPSRCPICGTANRCAMERTREAHEACGDCWCMTADFSDALIANIPDSARGQACICARCAAGQTREKKPLS
jgi:hypothetical protein